MRIYPTADVDHYWEIPPNWSFYCSSPCKSWKRKPLEAKHSIAYWRDIEGAKMSTITDKDLYFKIWPKTRIRYVACLPMYYCVGNRFIAIERAFPAGFKCANLPRSLKEVRELNSFNGQEAKAERKRKEAAERQAKQLMELALMKKEKRGEIKRSHFS